MGNDQKSRCSFCIVFEPHNFKILPFLLHGYQKYCYPHPTISKCYQPITLSFFGLIIPLNFFLEIGRKYESIIITVISNITVLVSHNVICFRYFMLMSHGVSIIRLLQLFLPRLPLTRSLPGLFVVLQEILCQPSLVLTKNNAFSR